MKDVIKLAYLFDMSGNFILADKLDKIARNNARVILADQGELNPRGPNGEDLEGMLRDFILKSRKIMSSNALICPLCGKTYASGKGCTQDGSVLKKNPNANKGAVRIDIKQLKFLVQNSVLNNYIKDVSYTFDNTVNGSFDPGSKILYVNPDYDMARKFFNTKITFLHELVHAVSPIRAKSLQYFIDYNTKKTPLQNLKDLEEAGLLKLTPEQKVLLYQQLTAYQTDLAKKLTALGKSGPKGRTKYFSNEEIMAQSKNLNKAFHKNILGRVYSQYFKPNRLLFIKEFKEFINDFFKIKSLCDEVDKKINYAKKINDPEFMSSLEDLRNMGIDEDDVRVGAYKKAIEENLASFPFMKKVEQVSGVRVSYILSQINDQNFYQNFAKKLFNQLLGVEKIIDPENKLQLRNKPNPIKFSSDQIANETSKFVGKQVSTPRSKNAFSSALPTISKLFRQLADYLENNLNRLNNSKTGKVFNFGMLVKDVYFIITTADKISKQINAGEEVMVKDQYDLGLTIVSILTDQQTQAILRAIFPPINVLLNNPQVQAWLVSINIGASLFSGAVSVVDHIGTMAGTTNKSLGATSGVLNTPGSLQALVMPVFDLRDKYGEVYNALIDVEKGMAIPQAIAKHIMPDASGGIDPYRSMLFYKFIKNKFKIIQYQNSPAFKKLPAQNQVLYPNANSAYAISSYKKARDTRQRAKQEANNRFFGPFSGGLF